MKTFSVVDFVKLAVHGFRCDKVISLVEEAETLGESYVGDGVEGEEVGVGAVVEG